MGTAVMCDMRVVLYPGIQKQQLTRLKPPRDQMCLTGRVWRERFTVSEKETPTLESAIARY